MKLKLVVAISLFAAMPVVAQAQNNPPNNAPNNAPKATVADAQKVVQLISGDKAKLKAYCDMGKLQEQMDAAEQKKDTKTAKALEAKADALSQQIGPEYVKLMDGLDSVDPSSAEGKQFSAIFDGLIKQCGK
jgi:hypothetical protein